jgi:cytochrome c peroxidase
MKRRSQRTRRTVLLVLSAVFGVLFTFVHLRAQSGNTKKLIPNLPLRSLASVPTPPVPGLSTYVANQTALIALGKALFWDQQTGSDGVQACASCHFNAGADSRAMNQVDPDLRGVNTTGLFSLGVPIGTTVYPNYMLHAGTSTAGFGGYHDGDFPLHKEPNPDLITRPFAGTDHNDVISSQGVFPTLFNGINLGSSVDNTSLDTSDAVFNYPDPSDLTGVARIRVRRVEPRNTPSVVNAVFNYRNFWDGRARNICNGANPFGERDTTSHFFFASTTTSTPTSALVRLQNSSLCSQALGPPGSNFEMSAAGRNFRDIGTKLLALNPLSDTNGPLSGQLVDSNDSVLGKNSKSPKRGINLSYGKMIQAAFQPIWWQSSWNICVPAATQAGVQAGVAVPAEGLITPPTPCPANIVDQNGIVLVKWSQYTQMQYNFSLFWGIAVQAYESTLRADQTPLDKYLAQQLVFQIPANNTTNSFSFTLKKPVTPMTVSVQAFNPNFDASDQDVFAFDDGNGNIVGAGITFGGINYTTGQVQIFFDLPPVTAFPTNVTYSVGTTPLTAGQLHGLVLFQTKARCVVCHGGAELTNASVSNVSQRSMERMVMGDTSIRVYDDGFYHIGSRPATEDVGLGAGDGITGATLSDALYAQQQVCAGTITAPMIVGRPGDGIAAAPLACTDAIANYGDVKTPGLRNVSLTAPYFHNGGQLTLEQVVEFYNRGGDFPLSSDEPLCPASINLVNCYMDPNVQPLGLTLQEKTDLVDFLRNGLLDSRTLNQSAPFDHPSLMVPNGHPVDATGIYPLADPNHPGQAQDQYMTIPANGKFGATPLPGFLQNLAKP